MRMPGIRFRHCCNAVRRRGAKGGLIGVDGPVGEVAAAGGGAVVVGGVMAALSFSVARFRGEAPEGRRRDARDEVAGPGRLEDQPALAANQSSMACSTWSAGAPPMSACVWVLISPA